MQGIVVAGFSSAAIHAACATAAAARYTGILSGMEMISSSVTTGKVVLA